MTTKLNSLERKLKNQGGSNSGWKGDKNNKKKNGPPEWHTKHKGPTYTHEGKEYVWCKEHKYDGKYNGLYMPSLYDHDAWYETFKKNVAKQKEKHGKSKEDKQNQPNDSLEGANGQGNA
eukprot:14853893-Ditylum_brightwellii.AAC.1